jgi:hypothetical protein
LPEPDEGPGPNAEQLELISHRHGHAEGELDVSEQRYEVMYFLDLDDDRIDMFKKGWGSIGDSIVVVGGDGLWNCHVHTDDIGGAIEAGIEAGRPRHLRITDLLEQVEEEQWSAELTRLVERCHNDPAQMLVLDGRWGTLAKAS